MTARRSLFVMVAIAIVILLFALSFAVRLQKVVDVTNDLIVAYSALDQWQVLVVEESTNVDAIRILSDTIVSHLPTQLGPQNQLTEQYSYFLQQNLIDDSAQQNAKALEEFLVLALFDCHRLQSYYSAWLNISQIALALLMIAMGITSYYMGRRSQDYRLAPFPEANPNPVFGLNYQGQLIYTNQAVERAVSQYFGEGGQSTQLLPANMAERITQLKNSKRQHDTWVHPVHEHIYQFQVQLLPKFDRIHVYGEDITEQEEIRARNAFMAYHDPVCLLANRQKLEQKVDDLIDPDQALTLVLTYVSGMAQVLSTQGLSVADQFAREYSIRLRSAYQSINKESDQLPLVFRFDANLFGCLYYCHLSDDQHQALEEVLNRSVEHSFRHANREFFFAIQSGVACEPSSVSARQLIQQANLALHSIYQKNCRYQVFDDEIDEIIHQNHRTEQALRYAIELDELEMVYQPQQDLTTGELIGFEALMRWNYKGGVVSPVVFIPIAEKTGLIHNMGNWALRDVFKQCIDWQQMSKVHAGVIAVNVSAQEFARRDFIEGVEKALIDYPVNPQNIQLEITESLLLDDEQAAIERMYRLKGLGFSLAIDDFGTGYSSFSYLSRFPIDKLKIDRSFVVNMQNGERDVALVAAMIDVAHQLGMKAIAEGVETQDERALLQDLKCDQIQGYLYGKPMSVAQATLFAAK